MAGALLSMNFRIPPRMTNPTAMGEKMKEVDERKRRKDFYPMREEERGREEESPKKMGPVKPLIMVPIHTGATILHWIVNRKRHDHEQKTSN